jgi:hypothetical protein
MAQIIDPKITEQWEPVPKVVTPGDMTTPPSDAIILFDGKDLNEWITADGKKPGWIVEDGIMTVQPKTGDVFSKQEFGDIQLHIEWRTPSVVKGEGQGRGNSGVFLMNEFEVQVLDSYGNETYVNGQAGAIYKQSPPLVNACRPPGEWQSYDIIFMAPVFTEKGVLKVPATITVIQNGVLIQNHFEIRGDTPHNRFPKYSGAVKGPIRLQDHSNPTSFRNIWVREL